MTESVFAERLTQFKTQESPEVVLLYPDGTINSFAQRYLRDRVLKSFEAKPKRTAKKVS